MNWKMKVSFCLWLIAIAGAASGAAAASPEDELRAEWKGSYVVTRVPLYSECTDHFTDNEAANGRLTSRESRRFDAGEVAQVSDLDLGWTGLKVRIELVEPFRLSWTDGPFTLYRHSRCRAELTFDLPREARKSSAASSAEVARLLERFETLKSAQASPAASRRRVEPLPEGWDKTQAEYETWKAAQVNVAVQRKLDWAIDEANRVLADVDDDPGYGAAFAAGVESRRYDSFSSCSVMLDASFYPGDRKKGEAFVDGEHLAWLLQLARDLRQCFAGG
jgi:hypothetical protein